MGALNSIHGDNLNPALNASQARAIMYADIRGALTENILIAAYCAIRTSAICGSKSICDDYASIDEDRKAVANAVRRVADILRKQDYACTIHDTALDIEWGE